MFGGFVFEWCERMRLTCSNSSENIPTLSFGAWDLSTDHLYVCKVTVPILSPWEKNAEACVQYNQRSCHSEHSFGTCLQRFCITFISEIRILVHILLPGILKYQCWISKPSRASHIVMSIWQRLMWSYIIRAGRERSFYEKKSSNDIGFSLRHSMKDFLSWWLGQEGGSKIFSFLYQRESDETILVFFNLV